LTVETVVITACWWGGGGDVICRWLQLVASTAPVGVRVMGRLVSGYSLPPPTPPTNSRILDHMALPHAAGCAAGDRCECPLICCLMRPVNSSCSTCSDAHNISRYNRSRYYDSIRYRYDTPSIGSDTTPIIVRSLGRLEVDNFIGKHVRYFT